MGSFLRILGIETSCDETAASFVLRHDDGRGEIAADVVLSQLDEHSAYGGVVPEIAARAHVEALDTLMRRHWRAPARLSRHRCRCRNRRSRPHRWPDRRSHDRQGDCKGPVEAALCHQPPRRSCADRKADRRTFLSYLMLLVSGGHTQLVLVRGVGAVRTLARRSTTHWAKPSTRRRNYSGFLIRAGRPSSRRRQPAIPSGSIFPGRWSARRDSISPFPA